MHYVEDIYGFINCKRRMENFWNMSDARKTEKILRGFLQLKMGKMYNFHLVCQVKATSIKQKHTNFKQTIKK